MVNRGLNSDNSMVNRGLNLDNFMVNRGEDFISLFNLCLIHFVCLIGK